MGINDQISKDEALKLQVLYREVFMNSAKGRRVFAHMLMDLGYWDMTAEMTEREMGRRDYAILLFEIMGIRDTRNIEGYVKKLSSLPTYREIDYSENTEEE